MARPYSLDLRKRAVFAVEREGMSCQAAARHFRLAPSTVIGWIAQFRASTVFGLSSAANLGISHCAAL